MSCESHYFLLPLFFQVYLSLSHSILLPLSLLLTSHSPSHSLPTLPLTHSPLSLSLTPHSHSHSLPTLTLTHSPLSLSLTPHAPSCHPLPLKHFVLTLALLILPPAPSLLLTCSISQTPSLFPPLLPWGILCYVHLLFQCLCTTKLIVDYVCSLSMYSTNLHTLTVAR